MGDLWHPDVIPTDRAAVIRATNLAPQHTYMFLTKRIKRAANEINWTSAPNLWIGTSVENQETADERIPHLLRCKAAVRFLSLEPLLGPINLAGAFLDWVILGCETGPGARPAEPERFHFIVQQCSAALDIPIFVKTFPVNGKPSKNMAEWPEWARRREWPEVR
jgi:protein gp37